MRFGLVTPLAFAAFASADEPARPVLNGTWQLDAAKSEIHSRISAALTLTIEQKEDAIHIVESGGKDKVELSCGTLGKDCKAQEEGRPLTVSFYYNGPALVETETRGHNNESVIKKRMRISDDGATLTMEVMHLVPDGQTEKLVLRKR